MNVASKAHNIRELDYSLNEKIKHDNIGKVEKEELVNKTEIVEKIDNQVIVKEDKTDIVESTNQLAFSNIMAKQNQNDYSCPSCECQIIRKRLKNKLKCPLCSTMFCCLCNTILQRKEDILYHYMISGCIIEGNLSVTFTRKKKKNIYLISIQRLNRTWDLWVYL